MALNQESCAPCKGGVDPLSIDESREFLKQTEGWSLIDGSTKLRREFKFKNFIEAQNFVNKVGKLAEEEQHHPDIKFGWGYAEIQIYTHKIGGLHENDFILAAKINGI